VRGLGLGRGAGKKKSKSLRLLVSGDFKGRATWLVIMWGGGGDEGGGEEGYGVALKTGRRKMFIGGGGDWGTGGRKEVPRTLCGEKEIKFGLF